MDRVITDHARVEAGRRRINWDLALSIIQNPQQKIPTKKDGFVFQGIYYDDIENKEMLLRAIVEPSGETIRLITVCKTSRIDKYWINEEDDENHL